MGIPIETYLQATGVGGLLAGFLWVITLGCFGDIADQKFMLTLRNKVIRRKAYKRELARLMGEAESARERYGRIVAIRKSKIEAVEKAIEPVAKDFSLANPGQSLEVVAKDGKMTLDVVRAEGYSHLDAVAAQVTAGTVRS